MAFYVFYWITTAVKGKKPKYEENSSKLKRKICHLSQRARRARGLKWHIFLLSLLEFSEY